VEGEAGAAELQQHLRRATDDMESGKLFVHAKMLGRLAYDFADSGSSRVDIHVVPCRRKSLGTYGGGIDGLAGVSILRGCTLGERRSLKCEP
jgi:hypothetical protein